MKVSSWEPFSSVKEISASAAVGAISVRRDFYTVLTVKTGFGRREHDLHCALICYLWTSVPAWRGFP